MTEGTACRLSPLPGFSESIPLGEYRRYSQHLFVMDLVIPLHITECFGHEGNGVEGAIILVLGQDCYRQDICVIPSPPLRAGFGPKT